MDIDFLSVIDVLGTLAFAISGASMAMQKRLDIFGVLVCSFATAIGGGTLRDMLMGDLPVKWLTNEIIIIAILAGGIITFVSKRGVVRFTRALFLFDSLGLGLFTVVGMQKALDHGFSSGIAIALGTITACFGGVIRDVLLNQVPLIFRKEIYATACIAGGLLFVLLSRFSLMASWTQAICILVIVIIRIIAVKFDLSLPSFYKEK
ncbi:MAG: trimeric intracellular cation channel family protein [Chitinophagaceae bacterium]|nr:trimeric intracellular cation channel family protein [Chitinophagaceae bacterium]